MATKRTSKKRAPWDRPSPVAKKKRPAKHLSSVQKKHAAARAKKAGRHYPNLVDNMREASGKAGASKKATKRKSATPKSAAKRGATKKSAAVSALQAGLDPSYLVAARYPLARAPEALAHAARLGTLKVLIEHSGKQA